MNKKMTFVTASFLAVGFAMGFLPGSLWAGEAGTKAPITRVVNVQHGKMTDMNVAALEESAALLKTQRPDLAEELQEIASSALN